MSQGIHSTCSFLSAEIPPGLLQTSPCCNLCTTWLSSRKLRNEQELSILLSFAHCLIWSFWLQHVWSHRRGRVASLAAGYADSMLSIERLLDPVLIEPYRTPVMLRSSTSYVLDSWQVEGTSDLASLPTSQLVSVEELVLELPSHTSSLAPTRRMSCLGGSSRQILQKIGC